MYSIIYNNKEIILVFDNKSVNSYKFSDVKIVEFFQISILSKDESLYG